MPNRTILLVEDSADDVDLVRHAFRRAGVQALLQVVSHGDEAIAYLSGTGVYADRLTYPLPRLILLDLKLPRLSGFEVLEWARGNEETQYVPVVVLTSSDQHDDIRRAHKLGANSYLTKPVLREALVSMLSTIDAYWLNLHRVPAI